MASIIPTRNLFIITSALNAKIGVVGEKERLEQTITTLDNLRDKVPDAAVLFVDGSPENVPKETKELISKYCQALWFTSHPEIKSFALAGRKSEAELLMMLNTLIQFKNNPELMGFLHGVKRIFKYSARSLLEDDFDITEYNNKFGKYVFKKSLPSWMSPERKTSITDHLYITRLFSFCPSLLDNYLQTIGPMISNVMSHGIDTEHAHYLCLDKKHIVEFDRIKCAGIVAGSGETERY
jgi:hypothetical protein